MNEPVIELRNVSKSFAPAPPRRTLFGRGPAPVEAPPAAVREVSLRVAPGEVVALLGPSGCGKTTTLRMIAGLETPDGGEIRLNGTPVAGGGAWVPPEKRRVGLVFQDFALFPHLTIAKNIAFPIKNQPAAQQVVRVAEMLRLVGLQDLSDRYPHQLSGGQQQRVALARALAAAPAVVLLDEPFSNLDADSRVIVREQVRTIVKSLGATVLFVTHDQEEALFMGDRVAVMNAGRLEQIGTPEEIFHAPATRFVAEFLGLSCFLPAVVTQQGLLTECGMQPQALVATPGTAVEILLRPDDLALAPDPHGPARVLRCVFRGMDYLYDVALPSGRVVRCLGAHTERYTPGTAVRVELAPGHSLACFRKDGQSCDLCARLSPGPAPARCPVDEYAR
jgi:iron(III) transport system ATP-binding protein